MKRHVKLCEGCIECLDKHFPYLYPDGTPMLRDDLVIKIVPACDCDNHEYNVDLDPVWVDD